MRTNVTDEQERVAQAMQESLAVFARLREQMRTDGPQAVAASLRSIPEDDIRQVLLALVLTAERAGEQRG
jgi:ribosomal 50S subunit-associated protein YjgA (DUF615 family)